MHNIFFAWASISRDGSRSSGRSLLSAQPAQLGPLGLFVNPRPRAEVIELHAPCLHAQPLVRAISYMLHTVSPDTAPKREFASQTMGTFAITNAIGQRSLPCDRESDHAIPFRGFLSFLQELLQS